MADDKYSSLRALEAMQMRGLEGKKDYVASLEARADEQALSLLVECLCDESAYLRDLAEAALTRLGERTVDVLLPHLTQGLWFTRCSVARVLGEIGVRDAIEGLVDNSSDANVAVADAARDALVAIAGRGHAVSAARALHRAPEAARARVLRGAERMAPSVAAQLARLLNDGDLMTAREDELLRADERATDGHDGVEWELLTGGKDDEVARR